MFLLNSLIMLHTLLKFVESNLKFDYKYPRVAVLLGAYDRLVVDRDV